MWRDMESGGYHLTQSGRILLSKLSSECVRLTAQACPLVCFMSLQLSDRALEDLTSLQSPIQFKNKIKLHMFLCKNLF